MSKKKTEAPAPEPIPEPVETPIMGRPTEYRPEFVGEATTLCYHGATDAQLADAFGVTVRTINRWKVTYPEFAEAIRKGKDPADDRVEDTLYHRAMGTEYERAHPFKVKKITYGPDGKKLQEEERIEVVMVKEVIPPDTTALLFWLKNRRSKEWREIQKHEHGGAGAFDQMSNEELQALIEEEAQQLRLEGPPVPKGKRSKDAATKH